MVAKNKKNNPLLRAIKIVGNQHRFSKRLGISQQAISKWLKQGRVPAERIVAIERITRGKVRREELRPDLYRRSQRQKK